MSRESEMGGSVSALWRYPVKSMLGEELALTKVTEHGLVGDRACALSDLTTGKIASAKQPRYWGGLLDCRAILVKGAEAEGDFSVQITLPDKSVVSSDDPDCNQVLSNWLGRPVALKKVNAATTEKLSYEIYTPDIEGLVYQNSVIDAPLSRGAAPGTFFNFAPVHVVTTATLRRLKELSPQSDFPVQRFRPNIVIDTPDVVPEFIENEWVGKLLKIGEEAQLQVIVPCPRCVMTTLPQGQGTIQKDEKVLRAIVQHNRVDLTAFGAGVQACVGVYARVVQGGTISRGDKALVS